MSGIRRIAGDNENGLFFDLLGRPHLCRHSRQEEIINGFDGLHRIGEKNLEALVAFQCMLLILEILRQLQVRDGIWGD